MSLSGGASWLEMRSRRVTVAGFTARRVTEACRWCLDDRTSSIAARCFDGRGVHTNGRAAAVRCAHGKRLPGPCVQFDATGLVPSIADVLQRYSIDSPWMCLDWLTAVQSRLDGRRPIDILAADGEVDFVVSAARAVGEQGTA